MDKKATETNPVETVETSMDKEKGIDVERF